jgi:hypothetical protein
MQLFKQILEQSGATYKERNYNDKSVNNHFIKSYFSRDSTKQLFIKSCIFKHN